MSFTVKLQRTVARKSSPEVAKKLLANAFKASLKATKYLELARLHVVLTETGHYAEATLAGKVSNEYFDRYVTHLKEVLANRFDPGWFVCGDDDTIPSATGGEKRVKISERPVGRVNLDLPSNTFSRIYGREAQIRRVLDAIRIGQDTNWAKRKHTLLSGPPGCGKTELCLTLANALGEEGESWIWFDATSTTKAGALEQLMKAPALPPILFVEEIEKCQENALRWLLGVMDERGEIRRTNYRVGNESKKAPLTLIATANNVTALEEMDSGAIYSRFGNRVHCPPPDRIVMEKILHREVDEIGGNMRWADAALAFGFDQLKITDCREIQNILLCGRDRLLTGEYQKDFLETMPPQDKEKLGISY